MTNDIDPDTTVCVKPGCRGTLLNTTSILAQSLGVVNLLCDKCGIHYSVRVNNDEPYRVAARRPAATACQRCGSDTKNGYCIDLTCPFSDHQQDCQVGWSGHHDHDDKDFTCTCGGRIV